MTPHRSRIELFADDIQREVAQKTGDHASLDDREQAFTESVLERLDEHNQVTGWRVGHYESRGQARQPAAKINGWALSGDTLDLYICKYHCTGHIQDVGKPETRRLFELLRGFLVRAMAGHHAKMDTSTDGHQAAVAMHEARENLTTVRLFLLTDGRVRTLDIKTEAVAGLDVQLVVWDLEKLSHLTVEKREVIQLDFVNEYGGAVPCLQIADPTGEYRTFLTFFPAPLLALIYGKYGQQLLERNVRAYLQSKNNINRGLQKTLRDEPHRFLAYNNGLCCTAADVKVAALRENQAMLEAASDFQIVNGGQTTASIYHALRKEGINIEHVSVQVKLTVLSDHTKVGELVPLISRYANSQNKVNAADFSANGPFHRQLEQLSRDVWAPAKSGVQRMTHWYYERARGSYSDDRARLDKGKKRDEWDERNPSDQKFTKTDVAKFEHAWMCQPHLVCLGTEKNFNKFAERMEDDGEPAVDLNYFRHLVAKAKMFRTAVILFTGLKLVDYRAESVAYAVAWLAARTGWRIDLDRIWNEQRLSPMLCEALKVALSAAHAHILAQSGNNKREAAKREQCWLEFKVKELPIGDALQAELSEHVFVAPGSEEQTLAQHWEIVRQKFLYDERTLVDLEALAGKVWIAARRSEEIWTYATRPWEELRKIRGLGLKKIRSLVELLSAAAGL